MKRRIYLRVSRRGVTTAPTAILLRGNPHIALAGKGSRKDFGCFLLEASNFVLVDMASRRSLIKNWQEEEGLKILLRHRCNEKKDD